MSFIQNLQEQIKYIWVPLLNFVKENDLKGTLSQCFRKKSALVMSDVAWLCSDQTSNRVFFGVFTHVESNDCILTSEEELSEYFNELGLSDAGGAEK